MLALLLATVAIAAPDWSSVSSQRAQIIERGLNDDKMERAAGMAEQFVGVSTLETSLSHLEAQRLTSGRTRTQPWSGHFWPNFQGGLSARWMDPLFPRADWGLAEAYAVTTVPWDRIPHDVLSPAEKYDLATGMAPDEAGSLTSHQWNLGRNEYSRSGTVATWQGICHGWAPASLYLTTPVRPVYLNTPEGQVLFSDDDIKALGSLYWANANYRTVYAGVRCNARTPNTDPNGRVLDPECFDVNPADWHLVLSHLVGARGESFIIDAENGLQVWNKPVVDYRFEFFDVANYNRKTASFRNVIRERSRLGNLRHGNYRAAQTAFVVGVRSTVTFGDGQPAGLHTPDRKVLTFVYDLELDQNYNVIGGEWREGNHPDFLWRPETGSHPTSEGDQLAVDLNRLGSANWRRAASRSNTRGVPLKALVDYLFRQSAL
jgi:hypothetical protein